MFLEAMIGKTVVVNGCRSFKINKRKEIISALIRFELYEESHYS